MTTVEVIGKRRVNTISQLLNSPDAERAVRGLWWPVNLVETSGTYNFREPVKGYSPEKIDK